MKQQTLYAGNRTFSTRVMIPGSKSITNRALLLASMAHGVSHLRGVLFSDDTRACIQALRALGVTIECDEQAAMCVVYGHAGKVFLPTASIHCENAATVARFLLAYCANLPGTYHFVGSEQLYKRPLASLLRILAAQGAKIQPADTRQMPLSITGTEGLLGGEVVLESSATGQFASALLMVAPLAKSPLLIIAEELVSQPYVEMTCTMMAEFGVLVRRLHHARFYIPVPQHYQARDYRVEPDFSTASYFFAAAAVTGSEVTIQAVDRQQSKQGDSVFLYILEKMGCQVEEKASGLTVKGPKQLLGVNVDMRACSDVFMTLAAMAPFAKTPTAITNIAHARHKESDRIRVMYHELTRLGVKVEEGPDWLKVYPSELRGGVVNSYDDHRIAMAFSVIGLRVPRVEIEGAECVSKTCPAFFELWSEMLHAFL